MSCCGHWSAQRCEVVNAAGLPGTLSKDELARAILACAPGDAAFEQVVTWFDQVDAASVKTCFCAVCGLAGAPLASLPGSAWLVLAPPCSPWLPGGSSWLLRLLGPPGFWCLGGGSSWSWLLLVPAGSLFFFSSWLRLLALAGSSFSWLLLAPLGSCWLLRPPASAGPSWLLLCSPGPGSCSCRLLLAPACSAPLVLAPPGSSRWLRWLLALSAVFPGSSWLLGGPAGLLRAPPGSSWLPLAPPGCSLPFGHTGRAPLVLHVPFGHTGLVLVRYRFGGPFRPRRGTTALVPGRVSFHRTARR